MLSRRRYERSVLEILNQVAGLFDGFVQVVFTLCMGKFKQVPWSIGILEPRDLGLVPESRGIMATGTCPALSLKPVSQSI